MFGVRIWNYANHKPNMKKRISSERLYLPANSLLPPLLEFELEKAKIEFFRADLAIMHQYIVYSFFEDDVPLVSKIYNSLINGMRN